MLGRLLLKLLSQALLPLFGAKMARSKQKKIKFSKGQIDERLLERTDLDILDSSASEITNMASTPYGSVQTRLGTENIYKKDVPITIVATSISGQNLSDYFILGDTLNINGNVSANGTILMWTLRSETYVKKVIFIAGANNVDVTFWATIDGNAVELQSETIDYVTGEYEIEIDANITYFFVKSDNALTPLVMQVYPLEIWGYITGNSGIERFIFNEDNKYIISFEPSVVTVYQDGVKVQTMVNSALTSTVINEMVVTQQEDVMIITHGDIEPLELSRVSYDKGFETWTLGTLWSYASNTLTATIATGIAKINLPIPLNPEKYYLLEYTVTRSAGGVKAVMFSDSTGSSYSVRTSSATYTETINPTVDGSAYKRLEFQVDTNFTGTITDVKIYDSEIELFLTGDETGSEIGFVLQKLTLNNIPKYAFDGEVSTAQTIDLNIDVTDGLVTITADSAPTDPSGFVIGNYIDGGGGRVKITQVVSTTVVKGITIIPFYTTAEISDWTYITGYEDVWSATRGYPASCLFYQQRLWFGGSKSRPATIWGSRVDDYNNFLNVGNFDNDAIDVTISSNQSIEIFNLYGNRGIQVFTASSEWIIPEGNLTPTAISISKNTSNGILKGIEPVDISGTTMFIEKNGKTLLSFVYTDTQASYITSQLSMLTDLIQSPIDMGAEYNSTKNRANYLYIVLEDGTMVVACILLDQQINSYVKFETEGLIKDVCVLGNEVYLLVLRNDALMLEKFGEYKTDMTKAYTVVDINAGRIDSEYEGLEVTVWDDDAVYGKYTVTDGTFDTTGMTGTVNIGLDFNYTLVSNKIAIGGQTENIEKRIAKATVVTKDTPTLTFCNQQITQDDDVFDFYGVTSPARDVRFTIEGTGVDYIEVLSVMLNLNYGDK
jgi:hypothetical protein